MSIVPRDIKAEREVAQLQVEAEAERYARERGMTTEEGAASSTPSSHELIGLLGGAEHAGKVIANLPASGGIRAVTYREHDADRARMHAFYMAGGGRLPDDMQPQKPAPPPPPRAMSSEFVRRCLEDGDTLIGYWG